jgi:hypothetical protein
LLTSATGGGSIFAGTLGRVVEQPASRLRKNANSKVVGRISYPDFIFAVQRTGKHDKAVVLEVKGDHLKGNDDTKYKKDVLRLMTEAFEVESVARVGEFDLVVDSGMEIECDLVLLKDWKTDLPARFPAPT